MAIGIEPGGALADERERRRMSMAGSEEKVLKALRKSGEPMKPGDIAEATGLPKDEVTKAINALKKQGKVTSPKRCFWTPAD